MSRFAIDPRWLLYLPPTMAPGRDLDRRRTCSSTRTQAFADYRADGRRPRSCARRSTWARARSPLVCRDAEAAAGRFGASAGATGRGLHPHRPAVLRRRADRGARWTGSARRPTTAGLFDELDTDWLLLDAELLPWSAKAERAAPRPVRRRRRGRPRRAARPRSARWTQAAAARPRRRRPARRGRRPRRANADAFTAAYRRYCWPTDGLDGVRAGAVPAARRRGRGLPRPAAPRWHLGLADRLVAADPDADRAPTRRLCVDTTDPARSRPATDWWEELTAAGGEGMVVKPAAQPDPRAPRRLVQPGLKVRGREYLRIIYGPDYTEPAQPRPAAPARPRPQALAGAARVRPRPGGPRPAGRAASRCGACTSASSPSSPWSPSRSTRGSNDDDHQRPVPPRRIPARPGPPARAGPGGHRRAARR